MQQVRADRRSESSQCPSCQSTIQPDGRCSCAEGSFPLIGTTLAGTWKLNAVLGAGGMGRVYDGLDLSLSRRVAVKVLDRNAPATLRERFVREASVLGKLDHPSVVPVYAAGQTSSGEPFIVMKWLDGVDLRTWAVKGNVALSELLPLLRDVAAGLDALHVRGIIHRDIKPENLMVLSSGRAMIIDLGVARTMNSQLTSVGFTVGTVDYIAPEQLSGDASTTGTDLYALALVGWELLANRGHLNRLESSRQFAERMAGRLPTLSSLNAGIPPVVSRVFEKALSLSPDDRYESGAAFIAALEEATGSSSSSRGRTKQKSSRILLLGAVVPGCLALALAAYALAPGELESFRALPERTRAPTEAELAAIAQLPEDEMGLDLRARWLEAELEALVLQQTSEALLQARYDQLKLLVERGHDDHAQLRDAERANEVYSRLATSRRRTHDGIDTLAVTLKLHADAFDSRRLHRALAVRDAIFDSKGSDALSRALRSKSTDASIVAQTVRELDVKNDRIALATAVRLLGQTNTREQLEQARALLTPAPPGFEQLSGLVAEVLWGMEEVLQAAIDPVPQGDVLEPPPATGVLARFPDNNSVVDDFNIGEFKRQLRDGQSIDAMLERMADGLAQDEEKQELYERAYARVKLTCDDANTKKALIDCDDEVRRLHWRFFKE